MAGGETWSAFPGSPHRLLASYVKRYGGFADWSPPLRRREMPFPGVAVILAFEGGWDVAADEDAPLVWRTSFVGGLIDRPAVSLSRGPTQALQFDLTPLGAAAIFGLPGSELAGLVVDFSDLTGRDGELLVEELALLPDWPSRFAALDRWLLARVALARPVSPDVDWAWRRLVATSGTVPIATLVDELGCSRRHLAVRFREVVGMTPKTFGRMIRFERAVERLRTGNDELGAIALDCGYYDQAHFNRDVRAFSGVTPGALLAQRHAGGFVF